MSRRHFMSWLTCLGVGALAPSSLAAPPTSAARRLPIRGICFDLFTLFDPRGVVRVADSVVPGRGLALWNAWKTRHFEYAWLRTSAAKYVDFEVVTKESLVYAARELKLTLSNDELQRLVDAYSELELWPDARDSLVAWKQAGLKLAPLANYSPKMLRRLLEHGKLDQLFDVLISTDRAKTYKPDPRAYALGPTLLGLPRDRVAFAAFGGWDAAGAKWFGMPTFWVNRFGVTEEQLVAPDGTGSNLQALASWLATR